MDKERIVINDNYVLPEPEKNRESYFGSWKWGVAVYNDSLREN